MKQRCFTKKRILLCVAALSIYAEKQTLTAAMIADAVSDGKIAPDSPIDTYLTLQEMQQSSTERKQASCRTQDMTQFCG